MTGPWRSVATVPQGATMVVTVPVEPGMCYEFAVGAPGYEQVIAYLRPASGSTKTTIELPITEDRLSYRAYREDDPS